MQFRILACGLIAGAAMMATSAAHALPTPTSCPTTPFTNAATTPANCNLVITFNPDGSVGTSIPNGATSNYDGTEDALIGVINTSGHTISSFNISGPGIFGFDGDGIDTFGVPEAPGNPDTTGYGGPDGFFTNINGDFGTVSFLDGIPNGGFDFFSLEESVNVNSLPTVTTGVPEPASLVIFGAGLAGLAIARRRRRTT